MLDIKFIRANAGQLQETIRLKKIDLDLDRLLEIDAKRAVLQGKIMELNKERNENAAKMSEQRSRLHPPRRTSDGQAANSEQQKQKDLDHAVIIEAGKRIKEDIARYEDELAGVEEEFHALMVLVPVIHAPDTPIGKDDSENVEVEKWGEVPKFDFQPKDHLELGKSLDILDVERGVKVAGFRGYFLKNEGAELVMAMMMHAMQKLVAKGFTLMIPPTLIKGEGLYGSGYFKRGEYDPDTDEIYEVANSEQRTANSQDTKKQDRGDLEKPAKDRKFLIGTAEPSLLAYYSNEVVDLSNGPIKMAGFSQCYRSEIGSYGKDTKGIYRVHEFFKVEQVVICEADVEKADVIQQEMLEVTKELHRDLGLPYRVLRICTGNLSAGKYKQFDMEAWIPSRDGYGETGSASNFLDWQARRFNVKYESGDQRSRLHPSRRTSDGQAAISDQKKSERRFVYMLNNTALPSVRPLIALLENHQQTDGSVVIPEVLRPWMGGKERIVPK